MTEHTSEHWPPLWRKHAEQVDDGWIDLSHRVQPTSPRVASFAPPRLSRVFDLDRDGLNVTEFDLVVHVGTHVDAPSHFVPGGPAMHEVPLNRLYGPGLVWPVRAPADGHIDVPDLEPCTVLLEPDDILLLDTGWAQYVGTPRYAEHPSLSEDAAHWLVDHDVKLVGFDLPTPDLAVPRRPAGFSWPIHRILLSAGVLIAEHLTGLAPLSGTRITAMCCALNLDGADGAPARILARPLETP